MKRRASLFATGRAKCVAVALAASFTVSGCLDKFDPASKLESTRVLAARVVVDGDDARAKPGPGEPLELHWLVRGADGPVPLTWAFFACEAGPAELTMPTCGASPFAVGGSAVATADEPVFAFDVPDDAKRLLVAGVFCDGGTPDVDLEAQQASCGDEAAATLPFVKVLEVEDGETSPNHNPSFDGAVLSFGDRPLEELDLVSVPAEGCSDAAKAAGVPVLTLPPGDVTFTLDLDASARETYNDTDGREQTETLTVSQFSSRSEFEREFTLVDGGDGPAKVDWTPPRARTLDDAGTLVRFLFVARDGRDGTAWAERAVCFTP